MSGKLLLQTRDSSSSRCRTEKKRDTREKCGIIRKNKILRTVEPMRKS